MLLFRLSRASFWLAAVAAALALLAPGGHETMLTALTVGACAAAFALWRSAIKTQRRTHAAETAVPESSALNADALNDAAASVTQRAEAAPSFEAALHAVAQVLRGELGAREVLVHEVREIGRTHMQLSTMIEAQPGFRPVPRSVRLDATPLGEAVRTQIEAGHPPGAVAVPISDANRVIALIELVKIELPLEPQALAGLLGLARQTLSRVAQAPRGRAANKPQLALVEAPPEVAAEPRGWPQHHGEVLVIEDNFVNPERTTRLLRRLGCRVTPASGMLDGLEKLSERQFDLVLVDTELAGMASTDGLTRWRRSLEGQDRLAPLVAMTGAGLPGDGQRLLEMGFDDHVCKPIRQTPMLALLSKYLRPHSPSESKDSTASGQTEPASSTSPAASADSSPVLDPAALARLAELDPTGANHLLERVLRAFQTSVGRLRPQADTARLNGDRAGLRLVVHTLKSSSASIGAMHLSQLCAQIETAIRTDSGGDLEGQLDELNLALDSALNAIAQLLKESA